jgi:hypothetical protein
VSAVSKLSEEMSSKNLRGSHKLLAFLKLPLLLRLPTGLQNTVKQCNSEDYLINTALQGPWVGRQVAQRCGTCTAISQHSKSWARYKTTSVCPNDLSSKWATEQPQKQDASPNTLYFHVLGPEHWIKSKTYSDCFLFCFVWLLYGPSTHIGH